jgi:hypothetical protein
MVQSVVISLGSLAFVAVGLSTLNKGRRKRAQSSRIDATETTPIRDLEPGPAEIKGTVHGTDDATLRESPLGGTEALAVHVEVEEWDTGGQGGGNWETIFETETVEPLTVDDGTGEVRVDLPADGGLNLTQTEWPVEAGAEPPTRVRRYVEKQPSLDLPDGVDIGPLSTGERRRYLEGTLEPGDDVYLLGSATEAEAGWDGREYVVDEPTPAGDFVLSDKNEAALIEVGRRDGVVFVAFGALLTVLGVIGITAQFL